MKIFKETAPIEQVLRKLEVFMEKNGIKLDFNGYQLNVTVDNSTGYVKDVESGENSFSLPRLVESEKIVFND